MDKEKLLFILKELDTVDTKINGRYHCYDKNIKYLLEVHNSSIKYFYEIVKNLT